MRAFFQQGDYFRIDEHEVPSARSTPGVEHVNATTFRFSGTGLE